MTKTITGGGGEFETDASDELLTERRNCGWRGSKVWNPYTSAYGRRRRSGGWGCATWASHPGRAYRQPPAASAAAAGACTVAVQLAMFRRLRCASDESCDRRRRSW